MCRDNCKADAHAAIVGRPASGGNPAHPTRLEEPFVQSHQHRDELGLGSNAHPSRGTHVLEVCMQVPIDNRDVVLSELRTDRRQSTARSF